MKLSLIAPNFQFAMDTLESVRIDRLTELGADFAWESALSGLTYAKRIQAMKQRGYHMEIIYLRLASPQLALRRIGGRVRQGARNVQKADVLRRFSRSWSNFQSTYRPLADAWAVYDNSSRPPTPIESGP